MSKAHDRHETLLNTILVPNQMQKHTLLVSTNDRHSAELTQQLHIWGYRVEHCHSMEDALIQLDRSIEGVSFQFLIVDHRQFTIEPKAFIENIENFPLFEQLTLILVGPQGSKCEQRSLKEAGYHFQVATPLDTRLLFTALHTPKQPSKMSANIPNLLDKFNEHHPRLSPLKILLAASDDETLELASGVLKNLGHTLSIAKDGQQALLALENTFFDITIIDKELPLLNGVQVINIHHLGASIDQWMPFVLLVDEEADKHYQSRAVCAHLAKPINSQQLVKTLYALLQSEEVEPKKLPCKQSAPCHQPAPTISTKKTALVNRSILKELDAMGRDTLFIHQLIHLFEEDGRTTLNELTEAVNTDDYLLFKEMAHLLLDSSSFLGTTRLYKLSHHATQMSKAQFINSGNSLLGELEMTFNITTTELLQYLSEKTDSLTSS